MSVQVTELTFLDHLARKFDLPVPEHLEMGASRAEVREALNRWGGKGVVKPDMLTGRRGKAGAITVVDDAQDAIRAMRVAASAQVSGHSARTAYMVQHIPAELEVYTAIMYDSRYLSPSLTISLHGGVDIESVDASQKRTIPLDVFTGLDAYQASAMLEELNCPKQLNGILSRTFVSFWDLFISTGLWMAEINPWRVTPDGRVFACDFKGMVDTNNYRYNEKDLQVPEYPEDRSEFVEDMAQWNASSHRGQAYVADLGGTRILPILFGGGASTIILETLEEYGGSPMFLSDFGGNPPYERMLGTIQRCLEHKLADASLLLILGGKANNTRIDETFRAISDGLRDYVERRGPIDIPVIVGRGGPGMVQGFLILRKTLEDLKMPYVIFGPDTPLTKVAEYAAKLTDSLHGNGGRKR
jgi:succinyl-CoA synthetase beta subunit